MPAPPPIKFPCPSHQAWVRHQAAARKNGGTPDLYCGSPAECHHAHVAFRRLSYKPSVAAVRDVEPCPSYRAWKRHLAFGRRNRVTAESLCACPVECRKAYNLWFVERWGRLKRERVKS